MQFDLCPSLAKNQPELTHNGNSCSLAILNLSFCGLILLQILSLLVAGPVSDWLGLRTWYLIGGVACIGMSVLGLFIPVIVNMEENRYDLPVEPVSIGTV